MIGEIYFLMNVIRGSITTVLWGSDKVAGGIASPTRI